VPTRFNIGSVAARGENGALVVSLSTFARLRSNPFFEVIRAKVRETLPPKAAQRFPEKSHLGGKS
jgi:hypothetical protein